MVATFIQCVGLHDASLTLYSWLGHKATYTHTLECPVRYKRSSDERLARQLVPLEGALSHTEGLALYGIAVATQAKRIIELGTFAGHSTNYLAAAARRNKGVVDTVDNVWYWGGVWRGQNITLGNRSVVKRHKSDALDYLCKQRMESVDLIFEDTSHAYVGTTQLIYASRTTLKPGGILILHDAFVDVEGCEVRRAVKESPLEFLCITINPGRQGLAVWRKPCRQRYVTSSC